MRGFTQCIVNLLQKVLSLKEQYQNISFILGARQPRQLTGKAITFLTELWFLFIH